MNFMYELQDNEETKAYLEALFALRRTRFEAFGNVFILFTFIVSFPSKSNLILFNISIKEKYFQ